MVSQFEQHHSPAHHEPHHSAFHEQHPLHPQHPQHAHAAPDHAQLVHNTEHRVEELLKQHPHDYSHVFHEIEGLRKSEKSHKDFQKDLGDINKELHAHGYLPHLEIVEDNRPGAKGKTEQGLAVVADDKQNPPGNHTMISTSHHQPHESRQLRHAYRSMHYRHGHYNGWNQSVEGHHGSNGQVDRGAVGDSVPQGARKELIDKALELAGVPVNAATEAAVNKIVTRESSWNPNITNNWDSNARAGHPSTGLMQTIPSTFNKYALPGYNTNIHDPLSNLVAGIRYADARYGHGGPAGSGLLHVAGRPGGY